ncbi:hypothetical protein RCL_jg1177.t1 [Rhizophagus clarus]|uniref:Uncharacterized protein n=1 Tax=Rhizophagus clarus TaxID=94130 RepID=A0A8H3KZJ9_9GLOM|nr:hypothetical protein RCL_jg1177.t1 [Rhizophagus clarus]
MFARRLFCKFKIIYHEFNSLTSHSFDLFRYEILAVFSDMDIDGNVVIFGNEGFRHVLRNQQFFRLFGHMDISLGLCMLDFVLFTYVIDLVIFQIFFLNMRICYSLRLSRCREAHK